MRELDENIDKHKIIFEVDIEEDKVTKFRMSKKAIECVKEKTALHVLEGILVDEEITRLCEERTLAIILIYLLERMNLRVIGKETQDYIT